MTPGRSIRSAPFDGVEHRGKRGPNGRRLCRWCGVEVPKGRVSWCGDACVDEFVIRRGDGRAADRVFKRDKGVCALCGVDTELLRRSKLHKFGSSESWDELAAAGYNRGQRLWNMDHVKPVVEGGGACGLDNLRTLCVPCHKRETAVLAARRARRARFKVRKKT